MLTQARVRELLNYNQDTGIVTRRITVNYNALAGAVITNLDGKGYRVLNVDGKFCRLHRIIWFWMTGYHPNMIDHQNGIRTDNRWSNLRNTDSTGNHKNQELSKKNKTGVIGVSIFKMAHGIKYCVRIKANGKYLYLGLFETLEEAAVVRKEAEVKYGYHENHGRPKV